VLESVFDAGFYLTATYPVRSDETKGEGAFGARKIEYDIIHVCRKRDPHPPDTNWSRMRMQLQDDLDDIRPITRQHKEQGLPEADVFVMRRGKALEYYSKHYGHILFEGGRQMTVRDALLGVVQILEEESGRISDPPPMYCEPMTRQFLRLFDSVTVVPRDHMQKFMRGTGVGPWEFEDLGWCKEQNKKYYLTSHAEFAQEWYKTRRKNAIRRDYDQARFLLGACAYGSGIDVAKALAAEIFEPCKELEHLLRWLGEHAGSEELCRCAKVADVLFRAYLVGREGKKEVELEFGEKAVPKGKVLPKPEDMWGGEEVSQTSI